ncbi:MAG: hypothetical protein Q9217_001491 [Psora testacea]
MAAVVSPPQSPSPSPHHPQSLPSNPNMPALPPLNTNQNTKRAPLQRPPSYAKNRMSSYSTTSKLSESRSRPVSYAFPAFHSSLPYALVRDFAYPIAHPCHYGPPPVASEAPSGNSTPASERVRRLSDPQNGTWDATGPWGGDGFFPTQQLPQMAYGDGPPYSEDEDLHSPVVKSSRHKKHKSAFSDAELRPGKGRGRSSRGMSGEEEDDGQFGRQRSFLAGVNIDGTETYYIGEEDESADGLGGELVTYPPDEGPHGLLAPSIYRRISGHRDSHFAATLPDRTYAQGDMEDSEEESLGVPDQDDSRYSRDYQFTIASPDEEMHGKAVALFDFARENENELPLTEGQVIWVSYRHGQGWLVAEDPKTGDAGLVPEEYVRLLRDIEGGWSSLSGEQGPDESEQDTPESPLEEKATLPSKVEYIRPHSIQSSNGSNNVEKNAAVVSSFSTSSKDLDPYPPHLLGAQAGQTPPQVVHYGSQANTPTVRSPSTGVHGPRNFEEIKGSEEDQEHEAQSEDEDTEKAGR